MLQGKVKRSSDKFAQEDFIIVSLPGGVSSKGHPSERRFLRISARDLRFILCVFVDKKIMF